MFECSVCDVIVCGVCCCNCGDVGCLENVKNLNSDTWRLFQLEKSTSDPTHPYSKFGTGLYLVISLLLVVCLSVCVCVCHFLCLSVCLSGVC